ncbi:MAG: hypothetical protein FWC51_00685 [Proteobacteria bacterium]|nr:hypothetical protein [Pseudomonadota bacterium]
MKPRIDKFLLDILWTLALLLAASFWFDIRFGFNIFLRAHWRYLANIQTGADPISIWFYVSIIVFALIWPIGLYLISHPHRKIKITDNRSQPATRSAQREGWSTDNARPLSIHAAEPAYASYIQSNTAARNNISTLNSQLSTLPVQPATPVAPVVRPPLLNIPAAAQPQNKSATTPAAPATPRRDAIAGPARAADPDPVSVLKINEMIRNVGFINKSAPRIGGIRPGIWAIGTDEALLIGIVCGAHGDVRAVEGGASIWKSDADGEFASPVWQLTGAIEKLRALFNETLDEEIKITIHGFVVMESGKITNRPEVQTIWDAFDIMVFDDASGFQKYLADHPNRQLAAAEQEDFDAYAEYMDTVAEYFNNQSP